MRTEDARDKIMDMCQNANKPCRVIDNFRFICSATPFTPFSTKVTVRKINTPHLTCEYFTIKIEDMYNPELYKIITLKEHHNQLSSTFVNINFTP